VAGGAAPELRVWAYYDGDTPVDGGRVQVYAGDRLLHEVDAADTEERTFPEGTALVRVSSLPRDIRVVVTGGRAGGRQLRGSLTAEVHDATDGTLVEVNPVTTLTDAWGDAGRRRSLGRGRNVIETLLGIPRILDDGDLRATDHWFDGDTFERYALAHGGVNAAVEGLVRYVDRPGDQRRVFRARRRARPKAFGAAGPVKVNINKGANAVLGELIDLIAEAAPVTGPQGVVFGLVMKGIKGAISLGFGAEKEVDAVKVALQGIDDRLAELKVQLGDSVFELQVEHTRQLLILVQAAQDDVEFALNLDLSTEKGRSAFAETLNLFRTHGEELTRRSVAGDLNTALTEHQGTTRAPEGPLALLPGVRRKLRAGRFLTPAKSNRIFKFYAFYETQQVRLATLLSEYHTLLGQPVTAERFVREIKDRYLPVQRMALPLTYQGTAAHIPRVFIDTNHKLMWGVEPSFRTGAQIAASGFSACKFGTSPLTCELGARTELAGFSDWRVPTAKQVEDLLAGRGDDTPLAWLENVGVGFDSRHTQEFGVSLWLRDKFEREGLKSASSVFDDLLVLKPGSELELQLKRLGRKFKPPELRRRLVARGCNLGATSAPVTQPPSSCQDTQPRAGGFILWVRPTTDSERAQYW
jgi:hypothetical protein